jgi:hypothetical protein
MIDKLKQIEDKLMLELLSQPDIWQSLMIDYHPPIVERLWTQINKHRISLHFIHTCNREDVLFHPHAWPSAMHVIEGGYEMGLGFGEGEEEPEKIATILVPHGNMYYDMTHIDGWHYVRPINSVCSTVMLSGEPWERKAPKSDEPLKQLDSSRKSIMLEYFSNYYRSYYQNERTKENITIQKGDWVEFDKNLMSEYDKKGYASILNMRGFVIKATDTLVDARFGNDRFQIKSCFLKKLYVSDVQKPVESTKPLSSQVDEDDDDFDPDFLYKP